MTTATTNTPDDKDVIDAEVVETAAPADDENAETEGRTDPNWAERAPLTAAFIRQFDAARNSLTERLSESKGSLDELQKKAKDLVEQVQSRVDKVREEGKEATEKLDEMRSNLGGKLPLKIDLESWLKLPEQARQEVLLALGIASDKKIEALNANIEKLREEMTVLTEAQTAVLKEVINAAAKKPAARKTTRKTTPRKTTARKTTKKPAEA